MLNQPESLPEQLSGSITIDGKEVLTLATLGKSVKNSYLTKIGTLHELQVEGTACVGAINTNNIILTPDSISGLAITAVEGDLSWGLGQYDARLVLKIDQSTAFVLKQRGADRAVFAEDGIIFNADLVANGSVIARGDIGAKGSISAAKGLTVGSGAQIDNGGAAKFTSLRIRSHGISWGPAQPDSGKYNTGDIVFSSKPQVDQPAGWICTESGQPGSWAILAFAQSPAQ